MDVLLKERTFAEISVVDLARKAKLSPATIYQRFSNVEATASVLLVLYFRQVKEWARRPGKQQLLTPKDTLIYPPHLVHNRGTEGRIDEAADTDGI